MFLTFYFLIYIESIEKWQALMEMFLPFYFLICTEPSTFLM